MKINIECEICNSKIKNAVRCSECDNSFCKSCIEGWIKSNQEKNSEVTCPHCRTLNIDFRENADLNNLIKSSSLFKCQKCLRIFFNKEDFESHQLSCLKIKCIICHDIFKDDSSFIKHFEQEGRYKEKFLICNYLNANPYTYIQNNNLNNLINFSVETPNDTLDFKTIPKYKQHPNFIKDEKKINPFTNNFKKNKELNNKNPEVLKNNPNYKGIFFKDYSLFYCKQINGVNNKLCFPGNEMCPKCMKINQEYNRLKRHYLINSAGRVCTYRRTKIHCLCHFERYIKKENKIFCPDLYCYNKDICTPCFEINKLLNFYLDKNLLEKLKKRDENCGFY